MYLSGLKRCVPRGSGVNAISDLVLCCDHAKLSGVLHLSQVISEAISDTFNIKSE
jgi:hypothetical protein